MKKLLTLTLALGFAISAQAVDVKESLKGHLTSIQDGKFAAHTLEGDPEYFVLYSSASW